MKRERFIGPLIAIAEGLLCLALLSTAHAAEIAGKIQNVNGDTVVVLADGDTVPSVGDKAEIFFRMRDLDEEIAVANGSVVAVETDGIKVRIEDATGEVAKDQLVRIHSAQPQAKPAASQKQSPPPASAPEPAPPLPRTTISPAPPSAAKKTAKLITLNSQPPGPLASDAMQSYGLRFSKGKGALQIFAAQPNMLLPASCRKVLLVDGGPVTSFTINFDPPVKRFTLYRIGTANGASTPTWKMTAYNNGKVLDSTGETHGLPPRAESFSVAAESVARVDITSDNRFGTGTWATWNSLPIAGFGFDR